MPKSEDFIQYYVQSLQKEIEEYAKYKALAMAREAFKDAELGELREQIAELEKKNQEVISKAAHDNRQILEEIENEKVRAIAKKDKEISDIRNDLKAKAAHADTLSMKVNNLHRQVADLEAQVSGTKSRRKPKKEEGVDTPA